ncbi:MAG TPA: CHAP domain-containing protein [Candidatus Dormibacteraeota bacterium]|nr:CHAP domain-containing protein [Candidatus Dormibacteraeota bacterium]
MADQVGALQSKRQALQQQSAALGPQRAAEVAALLEAEDAVNNLQNELNHNAAYLTDLKRQIATVGGRIDATRKEIAHQRALLDEMTRGQYKTMSADDQLALIFSSTSFGDLINNVMASATINRRISDTARKLKAQEADLSGLAAELKDRQAAAKQVQQQLAEENAKQLVLVAQHDASVAKLDADQKALASQIATVNNQIAVAMRPPPPTFSGGSFSSGGGATNGGGACGNHFDYGYCTWYVANRRCIPWFGNADEWYANARAYGYPEGNQARPGAVAVWNHGAGYGSVGHVAYVESVDPGGFTVSEMNYSGWNQVDTRHVSYSDAGPLLGFIYGK